MHPHLFGDDEVPAPGRAIFGEIRDALGIPWTPELFRALAAYPAYLQLAWPQLRPNVEQAGFALSGVFIADRALDFIREIYEPTYTPAEAVAAVGGEEQLLRETIQTLRYGIPQALLLGGALLEALKFERAGGKGRPGPREWTHAERGYRHAPVVLVEDGAAPPPVAALYREIREVTTLPFVPCEFRAVGRWPAYLALAWADLRHLIPHPVYRRRRRSLSYYAAGGTHYLTNPVELGRRSLERCGLGAEEVEELKAMLQLFAGALPGQLLNAMALEHGVWRGPAGPSR